MPESTPQHQTSPAAGANQLKITGVPSGIHHSMLDSHDQWHAWRIGRDCLAEGRAREAALSRLRSTYPHSSQEAYFDAGFAGRDCPVLTAPDPDASGTQAAPAAVRVPSYADALEQAAKLAIQFTTPPRDLLGPATTAMKHEAAMGLRLAEAIRKLRPEN